MTHAARKPYPTTEVTETDRAGAGAYRTAPVVPIGTEAEIEAWARHAARSNGFGDGALEIDRPRRASLWPRPR